MAITETMPAEVSSSTACERSGLTYRQLDYWRRNGVFVPLGVDRKGPGSGGRMRWPTDDLPLLEAMARLSRMGPARWASTERLRELAEQWVEGGRRPGVYVLTGGEGVALTVEV